MLEEGIFFNENRPLLGENQSAAGPPGPRTDERQSAWIRWPVTLWRTVVAVPIVYIASPLRRYDEAHPGQLPAVFAIVGVLMVCGLYLQRTAVLHRATPPDVALSN